MSQKVQGFMHDLIILLQEEYNSSLADSKAPGTEAQVAFNDGANLAYYHVLDLVRLQLEAFGYYNEKLGPVVPELGQPIQVLDSEVGQNVA